MKNRTCTALLRIIAMAALLLTLGLQRASAQRPLGIDVSRFQNTINWTSVKGSGISFAWAQATRGAYLQNANFTANMVNGKAAGVLMGAYHYAFPATNSANTEANYFWNLAGPYIKADGKTLAIMLDIEHFDGHVGATSYSDWANQWVTNVKGKAAAVGVDISFVLYSSASFMCNFNSSLASVLGNDVANYNGLSAQTGTPWDCCSSCNLWGGTSWDFWQYTSCGSISDRDVFNGTASQLQSWVATAAGASSTDIIIDNGSASVVGTWSTASTSTDKYGTDYRFKNQGSGSAYLKYTPNITSAGDYNIYCWYPEGGNRATDTPYIVTYNGGTATIPINQQFRGGAWNLLGTFNLVTGTAGNVKVTDGISGSSLVAMADAIRFTKTQSQSVSDIVIDNGGASFVGTWSTASTSTDKFGSDYRYHTSGTGSSTATYTPNIATAGSYRVYAWYPEGSNRTTSAPYVIRHSGVSTSVTLDQTINGGTWNLLGTWNFAAGTAGYARVTDNFSGTSVVMADAFKFVYVP
jgi:hypothetical protein